MSEENDGILGNLPRSRPGVRSDKRAGARRTGGAGAAAGSPPAPAAKPSTKPKAKAAATPKAAAKPKPQPKPPSATPPPPPPSRSSDPIGTALRAGETVALTGIKVAGKVAGGVLRRLPRP
ncbi:MAG TPA: hypothetical protein VF032_07595 [Thermoleophilaceae bacterium]